MFYLEIQIFIPAIVQEQLLDVKFQFVTPRFRPFGERMTAKINIVQDSIAAADALSSRNSVLSQSGALKDVADDKQQIASSESDLYQMACELSDEGFGEFDDCLATLTVKKGNKKLA